jgi:hypothetical protein
MSPSGSAFESLRGWSFVSERDLECFLEIHILARFTMSCNFRFELCLSIFWYFLNKMVSEIKRPLYGKVWIHIWDTCTMSYIMVCRQLLNTVQCCKLCNISVYKLFLKCIGILLGTPLPTYTWFISTPFVIGNNVRSIDYLIRIILLWLMVVGHNRRYISWKWFNFYWILFLSERCKMTLYGTSS